MVEAPLTTPLWEVIRAARLLENLHVDVEIFQDEPELEAGLRYAAHTMRQIVRDQVRSGHIDETEYDELVAKAAQYDDPDAPSPDAGALTCL